jgi:orotidine-5'-phosphate decarboxylase
MQEDKQVEAERFPPETARDRLIVALDVNSSAAALALIQRIEGRCLWVKVGLELYLATGGSIVPTLRNLGYEVFLDLKLHDIPNTVASAVRVLAGSGASLLTIHAAGGAAMMDAAVEAAACSAGSPRLLAVTVLTSMDAAQLQAIGVNASPKDQVDRLGRAALAAGVSGLICSPLEAAALRFEHGSKPLLVVPGIRPVGSAAGDQQRFASPAKAIAAGASMLVVGRPITQSVDPARAAEEILREIQSAL